MQETFDPFDYWLRLYGETNYLSPFEISSRGPMYYTFLQPGEEVISRDHVNCNLIITGAYNSNLPFLVYHEPPVVMGDLMSGIHEPKDFYDLSAGYAFSISWYHQHLNSGTQPFLLDLSNKTFSNSQLLMFLNLMDENKPLASANGWGFDNYATNPQSLRFLHNQVLFPQYDVSVSYNANGGLHIIVTDGVEDLVYELGS